MGEIRRLDEGDMTETLFDALANLSEAVFDSERAKRSHAIRERVGVSTYGYFDGDELLGAISVIVEPKLIHGGNPAGHIEDVAVRNGSEGLGVGRAMVEHAIEECRRAGCYKVVLDCSIDLVAFYRKCGFRDVGVFMRLDLNGG